MATLTVVKAGAQAALAPTASLVITKAGVQAAAGQATLTVTSAGWVGTRAPASLVITKASVAADGYQGEPYQGNRRLDVDGLWVKPYDRWLDVNGVWRHATKIVTPPPADLARLIITSARALATPTVVTPTTPGGWNPNTGPMERPDRGFDERVASGTIPVVWYEDLYQAGDTVTQAMARLTTAAVISFPEGRFQQADFRANGGPYSMVWPKLCRGVWGSGRGALGKEVGTIFSMVPNSSTRKSEVPAQDNSTPCPFKMVYHGGTSGALSYGQFRLDGPEEGHIYHGLQVFGFNSTLDMQDVLANGMYGNNGAPPGETFAIELHGNNAGANPRYLRVETDGRRVIGGPSYSAVGIDIANCQQGTIRDCYAHHTVASSVVLYESFNVNTFNVKCGDPSDTDGYGVDGFNAGGRLNQERTGGCVHTDMQFHSVFKGRSKTVHVTHSNDTVGRGSYSTKDGSIKFINPTFNDIWGDNKFYIQTWHGYWTGCSMDGANKTGVPATPFAVNTDGTPLVKYKYVHTPAGGFSVANGFAAGEQWTAGHIPHPNI